MKTTFSCCSQDRLIILQPIIGSAFELGKLKLSFSLVKCLFFPLIPIGLHGGQDTHFLDLYTTKQELHSPSLEVPLYTPCENQCSLLQRNILSVNRAEATVKLVSRT